MDDTRPGPAHEHLLVMRLDTPDGRLSARVGIPATPMRLAELAANAMGLDGKIIAMAERREQGAGRGISCRAGCGACCRQVVPLSPPEAWMIYDLLASMPVERRRAAMERFERAARVLVENGFKERFEQPQDSDEEVRQLGRDYFFLGLPCPFLEEESCSIHPNRPSICREYLVTSPAAWCADPFSHAIARVTVSVRLSKALSRLTAELIGGPPRLIPLVLAPQWAIEHREEGRREWDARQILSRLMELMSQK